jgi:hypothetical protein
MKPIHALSLALALAFGSGLAGGLLSAKFKTVRQSQVLHLKERLDGYDKAFYSLLDQSDSHSSNFVVHADTFVRVVSLIQSNALCDAGTFRLLRDLNARVDALERK